MDTPAALRKRPASSPLNIKAFEPTCSIRSISPPRARWCLALGPHPPPTMRSCFIGTGRGGVIAREIIASRVQAPPPPAFCTEANVAKGGAYLWDTTVLYIGYNNDSMSFSLVEDNNKILWLCPSVNCFFGFTFKFRWRTRDYGGWQLASAYSTADSYRSCVCSIDFLFDAC